MVGSAGLVRPKDEQELVGFGVREILGMKKRIPTAEERANWERQAVRTLPPSFPPWIAS